MSAPSILIFGLDEKTLSMYLIFALFAILLFMVASHYMTTKATTTTPTTTTPTTSKYQSAQVGSTDGLAARSTYEYGGSSGFLTSRSDLATQFVPPGIKYSNPDVKSFVTNLTMDPTQALMSSAPLPASVMNSHTVPTNMSSSSVPTSTIGQLASQSASAVTSGFAGSIPHGVL